MSEDASEDPFDDDLDLSKVPVTIKHEETGRDSEPGPSTSSSSSTSQETDGVVEIKKEADTSGLTLFQKARMEKNRLKALTLRNARLTARNRPSPYDKDDNTTVNLNILTGEKIDSTGKTKKIVDTGAGFFVEEGSDDDVAEDIALADELPAPIVQPDQPTCLECNETFAESFLFRTFDHHVCDKCKETEKDGKHELITKTDAKNTFLLKDYDMEKREPPLKFILRKNPHNSRWGDMRLYLRSQIEDRALEVWGSEEALMKQLEERDDKREKAKLKKFNKKIKALRMEVRGSLYKKDLGGHQHEFGEESYLEEEDMYEKTCKTCDFKQKYEKM